MEKPKPKQTKRPLTLKGHVQKYGRGGGGTFAKEIQIYSDC